MRADDGHIHPSFPAFALDIIRNVLARAADLGELGHYLTREMRELTGAKLVVLHECPPGRVRGEDRVVALAPERRAAVTSTAEFRRLVRIWCELDRVTLCDPEREDSEPARILKTLDLGLSIVVPLRVGEFGVGLMLLLGLPERHWMATVMRAIEMLSTVVALILRNSLLYDRQESIIAERTRQARESEARFRTLASVAPVGIVRLTSEGHCAYANERWLEMTGSPPHETSLQGWVRRVHPLDRGRVQDAWQRAEEEKQPFEAEFRLLHADGRAKWVYTRASAERDGEGNSSSFVSAVMDITAVKRAEEALELYRSHLEDLVKERTQDLESSRADLRCSQQLAALGTLAAGMAHQINNPLGAILNAAQFALVCEKDSDANAIWKRALEENAQQARRCGRIVRSILQFSRNEPTEKWLGDLHDVARRAVEATREYVCGRSAHLRLDSRPGCGPVSMNPIAMEQVVVNLIRNAAESRPEGVEITLRTSCQGACARLEISDDGRGIERSALASIFDPFYTTRLNEGGTGLGLSVAHGVVKDHSGKISAESEPNRGTRVTIDLPILQPG